MSYVANQQRHLLSMLATLRPHWRTDQNLPARIQSLLASNRSFGSRDRRLYRELIYTTLRYLPWIEPSLETAPDFATQTIAWLAADTPATRAFRGALLTDWPACPSSVSAKADLLQKQAAIASLSPVPNPLAALPAPLPLWFREHCPAAFSSPEIDALLARAPLWLRLQTDQPAAVFAEFDQRGWAWKPSSVLSSAIEVLAEVDVTTSEAFQRGQIEIQDLGSQMILASASILSGGRWLDACAGAGGKTLQLARLLGSSGHVDAHDIRPAALQELSERARRAGLSSTVSIVASASDHKLYDGVLVDAPCSGTGTWRRSPHLKWTTQPAQIEVAARQQLELLARYSRHVRPGGQLIYATCSLSYVENEDVIQSFLSRQPEFCLEPPKETFGFTLGDCGLPILPARHNTDGFFVAHLRRSAGL